jgi:hypothetical protein
LGGAPKTLPLSRYRMHLVAALDKFLKAVPPDKTTSTGQ